MDTTLDRVAEPLAGRREWSESPVRVRISAKVNGVTEIAPSTFACDSLSAIGFVFRAIAPLPQIFGRGALARASRDAVLVNRDDAASLADVDTWHRGVLAPFADESSPHRNTADPCPSAATN
ncbi:hypothetical protein [Nocardia amamiensis]|uniref:hypothetical protein n=1 Tax=Nocardia amamiensis TaxID=404578 RepID=UPI0012F4C216|nr:hypothetical protein [Nocardia amamiensis]